MIILARFFMQTLRRCGGTIALALIAMAGCKGVEPDVTPAGVLVMDGTVPRALATIASGSSLSLVGKVANAAGETLTSSQLSWSSSDPSIASVSQAGLVVGARAGQATITASLGSLVSPSMVVTVTPGMAARLSMRVQPAGSASGTPLVVQPVVEIQDAAGNVVAIPATVTATIATGGGTITGSTAAAASGVATFNALAIAGTIGDRTLTFSATGLSPVTSTGLALTPGAPAQLVIRSQPLGATSGVALLAQPVVEIRDAAGNRVTGYAGTITAAVGNGAATLSNATATANKGIASFIDLTVTGSSGDVTVSFSAPGIPATISSPFALSAVSMVKARRTNGCLGRCS